MKRKYAYLLLKCLNLKENDYLFISIPKHISGFKNILLEECKKFNLKEVYVDEIDEYKKHDLMKYMDQENINKHPMFDSSIYNKYAKLDAAFLFVRSMIPSLMSDIEPVKIKETIKHRQETEKYFRTLYNAGSLRWTIACVPNAKWSHSINLTVNEFWDNLYKICFIDKNKDAYETWNKYLEKLSNITDKLNKYNFDHLEYKNELGTDLKIYLPKGHKWSSGKSPNGDICNMPTLEVFTSPEYNKTEGIVYSSKPLIYNNVTIENFYLKFKDGKVREYHAETGEDVLTTILETDEYSRYLGECALVSFDSAINKTNIIFNETLYDENASCHIAIGRGFAECLSGDVKDDEEQLKRGVNISKTHVDFMIGTRDLEVIGVTHDNKRIEVIKNGNIVIE